ncbi:MAG: Protein translocase subunit SecY [candidate division TM6 bacterium GW2011_GWE2_31_21]|nr:MAG: Protein translocase subunit SecY [candidate division TM6 bacterium GW2011_GWE2_31_21]KKP53108.1 MAG: Protein translocase subunit SecY [candidate division TM6 bacterium GW2011_GWF2_33_332]
MVVLLRNFKNVFLVSELRKKVLFTLGILALCRFGAHIPIPGIDEVRLLQFMNNAASGFLGYLNLISGGALTRFSIFALGISPYITASIMMQVLTMVVPSLEALHKEGDYGRRIINQYTRYLTLLLSLIQSFWLILYAENQNLAIAPGWSFRLTGMLVMSVGALFVMWLGEQIGAHGIGNGSSMIIFGGIVADLPGAIWRVISDIRLGQFEPLLGLLLIAITIAVTACVIFLEKGERKIPVQYARRIVGNKIYSAQSSYIPFRLNTANVIPVIFAGSIITLPMMLSNLLAKKFQFFSGLSEWVTPRGLIYDVLMVFLIIFFAYFYTAVIINPEELSENLKKSGGFVPGIRPGRKTAEFFNYVLTRVCFPGAIYLATLVILPDILAAIFHFPALFGGTGLLITVGVAMDTSAQVESYLIERRYEGFLSTGRLRTRYGR